RYRHYDIWQTRVHLMESHFFAPLVCDEPSDPHWQDLLASDLRRPRYHIPYSEALGWRLRRNYVWLYAILLLTWLAKISLHPEPASSVFAIVSRAAIGPVPGWFVLAAGVLFQGSLIAIAMVTWSLQTAAGEIVTPKRTRARMERNNGKTEAVESTD